MFAEWETSFTFSTEISGHLINQSYSDPPDKDTILCLQTEHPFSRLIISLHPTRVRRHLFTCEDTCGTLAAAYKAGSGADLRCTFKICKLWSCKKKRKKEQQESKLRSNQQQLSSTYKSLFCLQSSIYVQKKLSSFLPLGGGLVLVLPVTLDFVTELPKDTETTASLIFVLFVLFCWNSWILASLTIPILKYQSMTHRTLFCLIC